MKFFRNLVPESFKRNYRILRSIIGSIYYSFPGNKLIIIGVTGTSGKSTTSNLIYHLLEKNDLPAGVISTVGAKAGKKTIDTGLHVTTPDPIQLQKLLRYMVKKGVKYVVVETSSHALEQGRLGLLKFDYAVYTNIKRDHLDWHGSWENYARSKARLIDKLKPNGKIILNREDKDMYKFLSEYVGSKIFGDVSITYSINEPTGIEETAIGTRFKLGNQIYQLPIIGLYNVENALAAINICLQLGISETNIADAMKEFMGLKGRMQIMQPTPFVVIVDFAHNTDSLIRSLQTAQKLKSYNGRVINIFGSAGLRDKEKRGTMGAASAQYADITIVTAEDPRIESLYDINTEIIEGGESTGGKLIERFANTEEYLTYSIDKDLINKGSIFVFDEESVNSRYDAIEFAIKIARPGDVIISEGKGHEESLCFGTTEYPFTDQEAVEKALQKNFNQ